MGEPIYSEVADQLPRGGFILVRGTSKRQAHYWAEEVGLPLKRLVFAGSPRTVNGLLPSAIVYLPGWDTYRSTYLITRVIERTVAERKRQPREIKVQYHPRHYLSRGQRQ